jgi:small-conductance mechanosensitive channel
MDEILHSPYFNYTIASVASALLIFILKRFIQALIRRSEMVAVERRKWVRRVQNFSFFILIIVLMIIWSHEVKGLAFGLAAFAVAMVIAFKEVILCLMGGIFVSASRSFKIGDSIEIDEHRGDVIDMRLLSTTLLEIGPEKLTHQYTGRSLVIPNSLFLAESMVNETYDHVYVLHVFVIPLHRETDDWRRAEKVLLKVSQELCAKHLNEAQRHMDIVGGKDGIEQFNIEPRVTIALPNPEQLNLIVRIPTLANEKGKLEQMILRRYLMEMNNT